MALKIATRKDRRSGRRRQPRSLEHRRRNILQFDKREFGHVRWRADLQQGAAIMPKFKVGDRVERIGSLVPEYMRSGVVVRVIPNEQGQDWFTEYEVDFDNQIVAIFYETQLRLVEGH
jgi:hypothetical protein